MQTNYRGYLIKVNGEVVNQAFFQEYKSVPMKQSDLNPYTDALGVTHREVLAHRRTEIVFTTPPVCLEDKIKLQTYFPDRVTVNLEYWNDEINDYSSGTFYIPDVEYVVLMPHENTILYRPVTITLIEY